MRSAFILAHLPQTPTPDVDYFSFAVKSGENIFVSCASAKYGSGLEGLKAEVLDSGGTVLAGGSATETFATGVIIQNLTPGAVGTYTVKLSTTGQDANVTGDWVRCGFHAGHSQ